MKRYVCTVAAGFVLALMGTATASANGGLPLPGQSGEQKTSFGDQTVGEQRNDADVTQKQGNWNSSFAPAIGAGGGRPETTCNSKCGNSIHPVGGNARTTNKQGNGNYAKSGVDQKNDVDQTQTSYQYQTLVDKCTGLVKR